MNMVNNKGVVYRDIYEVIKEGSYWPNFFSLKMKIRMIDEVKEYFEQEQDYGKVTELDRILLELKNE